MEITQHMLQAYFTVVVKHQTDKGLGGWEAIQMRYDSEEIEAFCAKRTTFDEVCKDLFRLAAVYEDREDMKSEEGNV